MRIRIRLIEILWKSTAWFQREVFKPVITCPAAGCFAIIWAIAAIYLAAIGRGYVVLLSLCLFSILMFFCVITIGITKTEHKPKVKLSRKRRGLLLLQIVVIALFICITLYTSLMFHGVIERQTIPVWSSMVRAFSNLGEKIFSNKIVVNPALAMANPAQYFLLPLLLLLPLGARLTELGFSRGHRTVSVIFLWCFIPVAVLFYLVVLGRLSLAVIGRRLLSHLMINGFSEEFLLRGALQTRLRALLNPSWAIIIQALIFGIWHFAANFGSGGIIGSTSVAAFCVIKTATAGLAYGIIFQRTRNLLACTVIHVVSNSLGG